MRLTGQNTKYDERSGAIIVQQTDEVRLLTQVLERLGLMEQKLDALMQKGGADRGTAVADQ